ncbi:hypothetical protein F751_4472 [Auxenochlorella protothecoides]|uniref:Uncharacterized protein n=1 Tax=Auxenochlorella protothecoides TaxID=3075 RepID=A0A087SN98_AUXPR|nr:hypothetical protein F751_4472 [Auxenochlorella protothecoides]KFM27202.1 hypothetical protein F751_4472 [Auxenochlorella protothecoides]
MPRIAMCRPRASYQEESGADAKLGGDHAAQAGGHRPRQRPGKGVHGAGGRQVPGRHQHGHQRSAGRGVEGHARELEGEQGVEARRVLPRGDGHQGRDHGAGEQGGGDQDAHPVEPVEGGWGGWSRGARPGTSGQADRVELIPRQARACGGTHSPVGHHARDGCQDQGRKEVQQHHASECEARALRVGIDEDQDGHIAAGRGRGGG